jgi:hypothetical protein
METVMQAALVLFTVSASLVFIVLAYMLWKDTRNS